MMNIFKILAFTAIILLFIGFTSLIVKALISMLFFNGEYSHYLMGGLGGYIVFIFVYIFYRAMKEDGYF